ncbi:unnamed protein product [Adineta ricciae]|uniref:Tetraspanin n=1 Tax=Adineta ricciae TaxID=249248 RepID=A0A816D1Y6_ADIRI|nr:unnamed protein product [Adineta ricciae]CAF1628649.1 unnamed protein product [Adineta ricciae]
MARLSCGIQCSRTMLFILNIVFLILGLSLLGFGIYLSVSKKFDVALSEHINASVLGGNVLRDIGYVLIIFAVFTVLLSTFGCCGAICKNRVLLYLYTLILSLLVIGEIVAFILLLSSRTSIRDSYQSGFKEFFNEAYSNNHTDLEKIIEDMEIEFKCCGANNVTDYYTRNFTVPSSCHEKQDVHKPIFSKGCAETVVEWLWDQFPIIGSVLGSIFLIEIFGIISSVALAIAISHSTYNEIL